MRLMASKFSSVECFKPDHSFLQSVCKVNSTATFLVQFRSSYELLQTHKENGLRYNRSLRFLSRSTKADCPWGRARTLFKHLTLSKNAHLSKLSTLTGVTSSATLNPPTIRAKNTISCCSVLQMFSA